MIEHFRDPEGHDRDECLACHNDRHTDRIIQAIHETKETIMADLTNLQAAIDKLNQSLANADTREAAEAGADQAVVDQATAAVNAAATHVDTLDAPKAPVPAPAPAVDPTTGQPVPPTA